MHGETMEMALSSTSRAAFGTSHYTVLNPQVQVYFPNPLKPMNPAGEEGFVSLIGGAKNPLVTVVPPVDEEPIFAAEE